MKFAISTLTFALAAVSTAQYDNKSLPFYLTLTSPDASTDGDFITACHTGAGIESLCLSNSSSVSKPDPSYPSTFYFNTSSDIGPPAPGLGQPGILTYSLNISTGEIPSAVTLFNDPTSDFALPLLYPGSNDAQVFAFDDENKLGLTGYVDYTVNPPKPGSFKTYYRWYSCPTYYLGYYYVNLVWSLGAAEPETPGCVEVSVKRVFSD
ncbi:hypothetical protein P280DRAFT_467923 [Massarina eburnea CBS 473.64]|uniref:DUF7907 domain-containing protein n=1 Tax=Massarina eburnea CBS 473.64 TaxID=1395130 RepID=A0A6A6S770_9PLEO|nr:hypothetical protein P280DRAFT_467923 [Massarina eburnea CBS 473.64]